MPGRPRKAVAQLVEALREAGTDEADIAIAAATLDGYLEARRLANAPKARAAYLKRTPEQQQRYLAAQRGRVRPEKLVGNMTPEQADRHRAQQRALAAQRTPEQRAQRAASERARRARARAE